MRRMTRILRLTPSAQRCSRENGVERPKVDRSVLKNGVAATPPSGDFSPSDTAGGRAGLVGRRKSRVARHPIMVVGQFEIRAACRSCEKAILFRSASRMNISLVPQV